MTFSALKIAPSILSCDFARLGEEVKAVTEAGADLVHIDVMDGHFVPNLTLGPDIIQAMRPYSSLPFDVHLMVSPSDLLLDRFLTSGADLLTVHSEGNFHLQGMLQKIRKNGKKAGVALNPATSLEVLEYILDDLDLILVMTVNPGFGGQSFISSQLEKIKAVRQKIGRRPIELSVDGGITRENASAVRKAGASILVAGTAIFKTSHYKENIQGLRDAL